MKENLYDFYKFIYYNELERKDKINKDISIPIGIVTLLISSIIFYIQNIVFDLSCISLIMSILLVLLFICSVVAAYFLVRVFFQYEYKYIDDTLILDHYYQGLVKYYQATVSYNADKIAINEFQTFLTKKFAEYADRNTYNNDRKTMFLFVAKRWIVACLVILLLTVTPGVILIQKSKQYTKEIHSMVDKGGDENARRTEKAK